MINDQTALERDILLRLRSGDEDAFRTIYERYSRLIYHNIMRFVKDPSIADDLLQDVFIKIWENRELVNPDRSFPAYLFTCSRNITFNFKRHLKVQIESAKHLTHDQTHIDKSLEEMLDTKEVQNIIENVINKLPLQRQKIFRMCKWEGMSYQEVAEELQISVSTVRDHIVKANKFVKEAIVREESFFLLFLFYSSY